MIPGDIDQYYKIHSRFYDLTRWSFLFGRNDVASYLPELANEASILDLGCGTGKQLRKLILKYPYQEITGIDRSEHMLAKAETKLGESVRLIQAPYTSHIFIENTFDLIVCSYSLSMISDINSVISTIKNHLKPGGYLLVVDFDSARIPAFTRWMKLNHVKMNTLFPLLKQEFDDHMTHTKSAWFGLYTYSTFLGKNSEE